MSTQKENLPTAQSKNKPYVFAQRPDDDYTCIKLTEGKYKDIIYKYGNVGFKPVEDDEKMSVIFDYNIMKNPNDVDIDEEEFINHIGDILIDLVEEQLATGKLDLKFEEVNE
tara:strand:+ start:156 stop:491 length:336 start_codon:yes stop_codon:yes gene_type:complete